MTEFHFSLIVVIPPMNEPAILDATDALGEAGCTDAFIHGHQEGMELSFSREARSLQAAIASAITAVEGAGFPVARVEMDATQLH